MCSRRLMARLLPIGLVNIAGILSAVSKDGHKHVVRTQRLCWKNTRSSVQVSNTCAITCVSSADWNGEHSLGAITTPHTCCWSEHNIAHIVFQSEHNIAHFLERTQHRTQRWCEQIANTSRGTNPPHSTCVGWQRAGRGQCSSNIAAAICFERIPSLKCKTI